MSFDQHGPTGFAGLPPGTADEIAGLVRAGNKMRAIKLLRDANPALGLAEARDVVESLASGGPSPAGSSGLSAQLAQQAAALLRSGNKIEAIKAVRAASPGMGLKQAKDHVDELEQRLGLQSKSSGCLGLLLIVCSSAALLGVYLCRA